MAARAVEMLLVPAEVLSSDARLGEEEEERVVVLKIASDFMLLASGQKDQVS